MSGKKRILTVEEMNKIEYPRRICPTNLDPEVIDETVTIINGNLSFEIKIYTSAGRVWTDAIGAWRLKTSEIEGFKEKFPNEDPLRGISWRDDSEKIIHPNDLACLFSEFVKHQPKLELNIDKHVIISVFLVPLMAIKGMKESLLAYFMDPDDIVTCLSVGSKIYEEMSKKWRQKTNIGAKSSISEITFFTRICCKYALENFNPTDFDKIDYSCMVYANFERFCNSMRYINMEKKAILHWGTTDFFMAANAKMRHLPKLKMAIKRVIKLEETPLTKYLNQYYR